LKSKKQSSKKLKKAAIKMNNELILETEDNHNDGNEQQMNSKSRDRISNDS